MVAVGRISIPAAAGLPSGGVTGRVLTKMTGADYAAGWLFNSPLPVPMHIANRWYDNRITASGGQTAGGYSLAANNTIYVPVYVSGAIECSSLAVATGATGSGAQLTFGFSSTASTGYPGTLLGTSSAIATGTAAVQWAPTTAFSVPQGWNWLSVGSNIAVTIDSTNLTATTWPYSRTGGVTAPSATTGLAAGFLDSASASPKNNPTGLSLYAASSLPDIFFYICATV